jgi:UDP-glucuronate 4-epimerase
MPMQAGDVPITFADIADLVRDVGYSPATTLEIGLPKFVAWYNSHYTAKRC